MAAKKKATISEDTQQALSALDWAVKHLQPEGRLPGEFTADEFRAKAGQIHGELSEYAVRALLNRSCKRGELVKRRSKIDGHVMNLYSRPQ